MTPQALADLHKRAFSDERPWSAQEFASLLGSAPVALYADPSGFALARTVTGESELLTLAVAPSARRQGIGRRLCQIWLADIASRAEVAFLEVAADNHPAIALYHRLGFAVAGRRKGYYARRGTGPMDALVLQLDLTRGQPDESPLQIPKSG